MKLNDNWLSCLSESMRGGDHTESARRAKAIADLDAARVRFAFAREEYNDAEKELRRAEDACHDAGVDPHDVL